MTDALVVIATIRPRVGHHAEVAKILREFIAKVLTDDQGCELYALHQSGGDFVVVEKWSSRDHLNAHMGSKKFQSLQSQLASLIGEKVPTTLAIATPSTRDERGRL